MAAKTEENNRLLKCILEEQRRIMASVIVDSTKIDAVNAALQTLTTDSSAALSDISAEIASLKNTTPDPATATALDNILTSVQTLDGNIKAADPGAITPTTPVTA